MLFFISLNLPITSTGSVFPVAFCTAGSYTAVSLPCSIIIHECLCWESYV